MVFFFLLSITRPRAPTLFAVDYGAIAHKRTVMLDAEHINTIEITGKSIAGDCYNRAKCGTLLWEFFDFFATIFNLKREVISLNWQRPTSVEDFLRRKYNVSTFIE